ncbi:EAL domain-containing protein [Marinobacteraceae bacterium S3BR75-40.1]
MGAREVQDGVSGQRSPKNWGPAGHRRTRPASHALRVAMIYLVLSLVWIVFSDLVVQALVTDPLWLTRLQTFKGLAFVLLTTTLLFFLIRQRLSSQAKDSNSEHERVENALQGERNLLRRITDTSPMGITVMDRNGRINFVNAWAERILGLDAETIKQKAYNASDWQILNDDGVPLPDEELPHYRVLNQRAPVFGLEHRFIKPGQGEILLAINAAPLFNDDGDVTGVVATFQDITAQRRNEQQIRKLNRVYNVLAQINHLIQRTPDQSTLLREACRIAVEEGGFRMAWIGLVNPESQKVRPTTCAGYEKGYLDKLDIALQDNWSQSGPTRQALARGSHVVCNDIAAEPEDQSWRQRALQRGYRASAAFPLQSAGRILGTFNLYAAKAGFFTAEELQLIDQLAGDLSLAMTLLEREEQRQETELRLRQSEARYRSLFEEQNSITVLADPESATLLDANPAACRWYGWDRAEVPGKAVADFVQTPMDLVHQHIRQAATGEVNYFEEEHFDAHGEARRVEIYSSTVMVDDEPLVYAIIHDVHERYLTQEKLRLNNAVVESIRDSVMVMDLQHRTISVNPAFTMLTGYTKEDAVGKTPEFLRSPRHGADFFRELWTQVQTKGYWQGEIWHRHKDGSLFPGLLSLNAVYNEQGQVTHYVAVTTDISSLKESEERLDHLANYDLLTNLPNRILAESRLNHSIEQAQRHERRLAVLFMDLDSFKTINDSLGHPVGDELLVAVAQRLAKQVRREDTLARFGGDKFMLIIEEFKEPQRAAVVARHIHTALQSPFTLPSGNEVFVSASLGISVFPEDGASAGELMRNAETAMYEAKKQGRNQFCYFTTNMNVDARAVLEMESALRQALMRHELMLYYQPKLNLASGQICGVEALLRWQRPNEGMVSPGTFIPLAEQTGLIVPIGNWVLEEACRQIKRWQDAGLSQLRVAVNVSVGQFRSGNLQEQVENALRHSNIPPECLELELTESMLMEHTSEAIRQLKDLKQLGVRLSLDDFGTGYSSLAYLSRFPIDALKIDKSFVAGLLQDSTADTITASIIDLAHRMGLKVVAEGVETQEQLDYLNFYGCDEMQGFFFAKPLPVVELEALAREGRGLPMEG